MNSTASDPVLSALLSAYWAYIKTERIGETPKVTAELDALEKEIRSRQQAASKPPTAP